MERTPLENWIVYKSGITVRSRKALEEYQLGRIRETVKYAKNNSRFYAEQLKSVSENELQSLEDLQAIPFTYSYQIRQNSSDFLCVPQKYIARVVTLNSSGTTGEEKRIYFTEEDLNHTIEFFKYGMSCLTNKSDRVLVLLPGKAYGTIGDLLKKALALSEVECFVHGVMIDPEDTAKSIEDNDITCIVGIPAQVLYLSRLKTELFKSRIKKVLLSTDYVPETLIHELTQLGCSVFNHYGMTEMGYGGGVECQALNGYHMREADLYFEIVDPDTGKAVPDGQYGEVVFTTLTRKAMPLIRYRTGDLACFSPTSCACTTFLPTMKRVLGRIDNRVCIRDNQFIYLRDLDEIILGYKEIIDYKAYMTEPDRLNVEIVLKSGQQSPDTDSGVYSSIRQSLCDAIQKDLYCRLGYIVNPNVTAIEQNKSDKITNSMVKRKIFDLRGSDNGKQ